MPITPDQLDRIMDGPSPKELPKGRKAAVRLDSPTYRGSICRYGHTPPIRRTSNGVCVRCSEIRTMRRTAKRRKAREERKEQLKQQEIENRRFFYLQPGTLSRQERHRLICRWIEYQRQEEVEKSRQRLEEEGAFSIAKEILQKQQSGELQQRSTVHSNITTLSTTPTRRTKTHDRQPSRERPHQNQSLRDSTSERLQRRRADPHQGWNRRIH